jgi:hypothetical protein
LTGCYEVVLDLHEQIFVGKIRVLRPHVLDVLLEEDAGFPFGEVVGTCLIGA